MLILREEHEEQTRLCFAARRAKGATSSSLIRFDLRVTRLTVSRRVCANLYIPRTARGVL